MDPSRVLIVDDDEPVRHLLANYLQRLSYDVEVVGDVGAAIRAFEDHDFEAVLTDIRMPGPDGLELLGWLASNRPEAAVVMLSGCNDIRVAVRAMREGARDYINKPYELQDVADTLSNAIHRQRQERKRVRRMQDMEALLQQRSGELASMQVQLRAASRDALEALVSALDARERETQAHSNRVARFSVYLAREMGVAAPELDVIEHGAMLHDIGKIGISDSILLKPSPLTEDEWAEMRKHPEIGAWILNSVESLKSASEIVLTHHERFDGEGYPNGIRGRDIPLGARIFAIADCLDAVVSDRPYRRGQPYQYAREEIQRNSGTQFDSEVVDCFMRTPEWVWNRIREASLQAASS